MVEWKIDNSDPAPKKPIIRIYCFDCKRDIYSKRAAGKGHKGHDVDYVDLAGNRQTD